MSTYHYKYYDIIAAKISLMGDLARESEFVQLAGI